MESLRRDTELSMITKADVDKLKRQLKKEEAELSRLKSNAKSQKKMRVKKKKLIKKACEEDENLAKILKSISRNQVGRPRIEEDQPQILQTILDIVDASSAAHDCRREPIRKLAVDSNLCHFWAFSEYMNCNILILLKTF